MRIIAGEARGRPIVAPDGQGTRPPLDRMRGSIFDILGGAGEDAEEVLDLYAGSGSFGLEAISRGARRATFVERDPIALRALERNILDLGFSARARVMRKDALRWPAPPGQAGGEDVLYDLAFVDPPFRVFAEAAAAAEMLDRVEALVATVLRPGGVLVLRHPTDSGVMPRRAPAGSRVFGESTVLIFGLPPK
jgi:16S rRNA (guanine966-N2)-methyltransferase